MPTSLFGSAFSARPLHSLMRALLVLFVLPAVLALAPASSAQTLSGFTATGIGPTPHATVTLSAPAPAAGTIIALSSSNPFVAIPATVKVAAGTSSATVPVTTQVTTDTSTTLTASYNSVTLTAPISFLFLVPSSGLSSVAVDPASLVGGSPSTGSVTVLRMQPGSSVVVSLRSSSPAVSVPASVSVSVTSGGTSSATSPGVVAGLTGTATFPVTTTAVSVPTFVTITATTAAGTRQTAALTVNPPSLILTSIAVSPLSATLITGATQTFTAVAKDQNGTALATQPPFTWTSTGVGAITSAGVYSAGTTAGTATVKATSGTVSGTAAVTVNPVASQAALSLTATATGANKVTLYWNGISGASGYNVYRSAISGGPYTQIAVNVTGADTGPGLTNAFMYSNTAGLTTGMEYFYVVRAVQSGSETVQSNEDSAVPNASAIPWDTGNPTQIVSSMISLLNSTLPPDDFANPTPPDVGFLSIGGPDGVVYQGNIPTGSVPRAIVPSGHYDATNGTIDYSDGTALPAPSDGDDAISGQATTAQNSGIQPNVVQNPPVYNYPAYTPNPTGTYHKVESQPGYSGFRGIVGLPLPGDTGLVLNKSGTQQDAAYIYTGGLLFPTVGQKYRNGSTLDMDIGLQLGHSDPITNPGWKPIILFKGSALESEVVDGDSPGSGESVFIQGDALNGEQMFLYTSGVFASGATTNAQSAATDNLVVLRLVGPYVYRKQITPGFNTDKSYNGAVTCTFFASGWGKFYPRNGPQAPLVPKRFIIKRCNSIAQTLNNPRINLTPRAGLVNPNGPPGVATNQAGFYTSGSSIIGASWGTADDQSVTIYGPSGWESWQDQQTWVDTLGQVHSGSYPPVARYVDWLDQNDFFWEVNVSLQTRP